MFRGVSLLAQSSFSRLARSHRDEFSRCSQLPSRYLHREREDRPPRKCFKLHWIVRRCRICKVILRVLWRANISADEFQQKCVSSKIVRSHECMAILLQKWRKSNSALNKSWLFRVRWLYTLGIMRTFFILFFIWADYLRLRRITVLHDQWLIFVSRYRRSSSVIFGKN